MDDKKCKKQKANFTFQKTQGEFHRLVKIKEEEEPTDISTDCSSNRNSPETCPTPRYSQNRTEEAFPADKPIKEENLNIVIVDIGPEIQKQNERPVRIKEEEIPADISPVHLNTRRSSLRNPYKKWWSPAKSSRASAHKMDLSKKKIYSEYLMNPQFLKEFIDMYRSFPCLWNMKISDYSNKQKRLKAYDSMVNLCRSVCPSANIQFVKHKIANLRTVFKKEFNKVQVSKKTATSADDVYVPRLWYFDLLKFTIGQDAPKEGSSNSGESQECRQEDEPVDETMEILEDSTNVSQVTSNSQSEDIDYDPQEDVPFIRKRKKGKMYNDDDLSNELLSQAAAILSKNNDEYDAFGITVASKLRRMEEKQRLVAEVLIMDVLYKGMLNQLSEESYIADYPIHYYSSNAMS
ncbi:uncharacterized protein LOC122939810 isoform X1 [Bufo gargarizans]|uniref:uncharacterized protein LOC122939810 isoform X1 n=1 Tax=Bufo gargarizans TaxID=30331 RepID=UPI001CF2267A|nr:uncharacterized protein LOC122939810 isoform X1 [Bufo gargarizans]